MILNGKTVVKMRNIKVVMSYNGTAYHGFQRQNNAPSIQQTVEEALSVLLKHTVAINGCSRTDAGVHANEFVFNFRTDSTIPCDGLIKGANALLPQDIAFISCEDKDDAFHARFGSVGKEYIYKIYLNPIRDVFASQLALHYPYKLDIEKMRSAARLMTGTHDFAAFCKAESIGHLATTVRTVYSIEVTESGAFAEITVRGNGFLHNMVRIIAGTLIYVSEGKRCEADILNALEKKDRESAGKTVPACGLYLNRVFYDGDALLQKGMIK